MTMSMRPLRRLLAGSVVAGTALAAAAGPVAADGHTTRLTTNMSWQQSVDTGATSGYGFAAVRLDDDRVCFGLRWTNTDQPVAAHIHYGAAGETGPVAVGLFMGQPGPQASAGSAWGCVGADEDMVDAIAENPEMYYVNLHTPSAPAGQIRGQLG